MGNGVSTPVIVEEEVQVGPKSGASVSGGDPEVALEPRWAFGGNVLGDGDGTEEVEEIMVYMDEAPRGNLDLNMRGRELQNQIMGMLRPNEGGRFREQVQEIRDGRQRQRMEEEIRQLRELVQVMKTVKSEDSLFNQVGFLSGLALGSVFGFLCALSFFIFCKVEVTSAKSV